MENEETEVIDNELSVIDGTYVDQETTLDSMEVPEMTEQEADEYKEQEEVEIEEEGGK